MLIKLKLGHTETFTHKCTIVNLKKIEFFFLSTLFVTELKGTSVSLRAGLHSKVQTSHGYIDCASKGNELNKNR